jgi:hypothetical protein
MSHGALQHCLKGSNDTTLSAATTETNNTVNLVSTAEFAAWNMCYECEKEKEAIGSSFYKLVTMLFNFLWTTIIHPAL